MRQYDIALCLCTQRVPAGTSPSTMDPLEMGRFSRESLKFGFIFRHFVVVLSLRTGFWSKKWVSPFDFQNQDWRKTKTRHGPS